MLLSMNDIFSGNVAADGTKTAQAVTGTAISTHVMDVRNSALPVTADEGIAGESPYLIVSVVQAFNTLTSLTVSLESDISPTLATAPVVHFSVTVALAGLVAGATLVRVQLPSSDYKRYMGLRYTVTGAAPTTGLASNIR